MCGVKQRHVDTQQLSNVRSETRDHFGRDNWFLGSRKTLTVTSRTEDTRAAYSPKTKFYTYLCVFRQMASDDVTRDSPKTRASLQSVNIKRRPKKRGKKAAENLPTWWVWLPKLHLNCNQEQTEVSGRKHNWDNTAQSTSNPPKNAPFLFLGSVRNGFGFVSKNP